MSEPGIVDTLHPLEVQLLLRLGESADAEHRDEVLAATFGTKEGQHRRPVELLLGRGFLEKTGEDVRHVLRLSEAGKGWAERGLPEVRVLRTVIRAGETTVNALKDTPGIDPAEVGPAVGALKKAGAVEIGAGGVLTARPAVAENFEILQTLASELAAGNEVDLDGLGADIRALVESRARKRGKDKGAFQVSKRTHPRYRLTDAGRGALRELNAKGVTGEEISALTPAMLRDGTWRGKAFRKYNLSLAPPRIHGGRKHPYRAYLDWVKGRLLALGFREMTGSLVEPEFWNMDALFMPQFHASREIHDSYRIREPNRSEPIPSPAIDRVESAHVDGGETGSRGWRYAFDRDKARRHVLRSQGTVLSVRQLASKPRVPGKYFAMARCFRPDQVDATHAVDFLQVEGIVLGEDVTFRTLLGLLRLFALEIARSDELEFVPSYFPFTEPSVEVMMKHPKLGWTELGGAGIFRREVTAPMGVSVPVAAWGLGLDRMAMVALGIDDIRDLFSRDLNKIRETKVKL
jgi:phenylalanyl-tRNA synthetase alpha chain